MERDIKESINPSTIDINTDKTITATFSQNFIQKILSSLPQTNSVWEKH